MSDSYDAIIVGARCGGAPLAMLLARAGHKVLLLERMALGSDIMSTHYLKRTGASLLAKWGLLDEVLAAGTPAIRQVRMDLDGFSLAGTAPAHDGVDHDVTPRRYLLDKILVDAAIAAGVEVRDRFAVRSLLFDGDRVVGVRGAERGGSEVAERARVVVGADGARSTVGDAVGAERYLDAGIHTCGYYGYYRGMRDADDTASLYVRSDAQRFYITFPTNDGLDMVFLFWGRDQTAQVRKDVDAAFSSSLELVPELEARVAGAERESRLVGTHLLYNFFRRAHGPGWALVGDAALHRDPITAQGITNAFTHADILGEELCAAFAGDKAIDAALASYDARQFEKLKPMFDYTVHLAMLKPPAPELQALLPALAADEAARGAFLGAFLGSTPLDVVFPPEMLDGFAADVRRGEEEVRRAA